MAHRGHILIIFGLSLMISPFAIALVQDRMAAEAALSASIQTDGAATSACRSASVETVIGRLGCQNANPDRTMAGGAMFVSAQRH